MALCFIPKNVFSSTLFSDDFTGTTINTSNWTKNDTGTNVAQNDGLTITGNNTWAQNGVESIASFPRGDSLTVEVVAKASATNTYLIPLGYGDFDWYPFSPDKQGYFIDFFNTGHFKLFYVNGGFTEDYLTDVTYTADTWYKIQIVIDDTQGATFKVYKDLNGDGDFDDDGEDTDILATANYNSVLGGTFTDKKIFSMAYSGGVVMTIDNANVSTLAGIGSVSSVTTTAGDGQNQISWTNPSDEIFTGVMIRYRTDTYPTSISDGTLVIDQSGTPGVQDSYTHTELTNGQTYYYTLFAHDSTPTYDSGVNTSGTPATPTPTVTITSPTENLTVHDQFYDFQIPWIQTSQTINVSATGSDIAAGGGLEFVLDEGTASESSVKDLTSPYTATFTSVAKGTHTIDVYALEADGTTRVSNPEGHQQLTNIGIGDIIVVFGDSTSAGSYGNSVAGSITNCAGSTYHSTDCRTFEQRNGNSGITGPQASYHVELANKMGDYYGYPVFIINEAWGSSNSYHLLNTIFGQTQFENRMTALQPNKFLINQGVNDARCEAGGGGLCSGGTWTAAAFGTRMQDIVNYLKTNYGASNSDIWLARFNYDTTAGIIAISSGYLSQIASVISANSGVHSGPNLQDFFYNNQSYMSDIVHPTVAGYIQIARLWAISMIQPQNLSASQSGSKLALSWNDLSAIEETLSGSTIQYGTTSGEYTTTIDVGDVTSTTIEDLNEGAYYIVVSAYDNDEDVLNTTMLSTEVFVSMDKTAPILSSTSSAPNASGATITFTTNESGSTLVEYGPTIRYGFSTSETDTAPRVTNHSVPLQELVACSTYHYRVKSTDASSNTATGSDNTFTTTGCTGSASVLSQTGATLEAGTGGTLQLGSGTGLTLTVPANFTSNDVSFQIKGLSKTETLNTTSTPSGRSLAGDHIFDLQALSGATLAVSSFDEAITITITYADTDVASLDESSLRIFRWDGSSWNELSGCTVDAVANTVTCTTTSFSVFGLFGSAPVSTSPAASTTTTITAQTSGGRRGSPQAMTERITQTHEALLARYAGNLRGAMAFDDESQHGASESPMTFSSDEERAPYRAAQKVQETLQKKVAPDTQRLSTIADRRGLLLAFVDTTPVLYRDVPTGAWFAPYVASLIEDDVATGYRDDAGNPTGEFGVSNPVTVAEVLKMALEAAQIDIRGFPPPRNRTAKGTWVAAHIAKAEELNLMVATPNRDVHSPATRGEVVQSILEVFRLPLKINESIIIDPFTDLPPNHPYRSAILSAMFHGIIEGDIDGQGNSLHTVRPDDPINRAEVSKIIALMKDVFK